MKSERIVDWERDAPQWPDLVKAAHGQDSAETPTSPAADGQRGSGLWQVYGPLVECNAPDASLVIGQLGQSLDGRIATTSGQSHYINGSAAIVHLHRLRALADAVVIGVGTALADDPQLTVRHVTGPQPARVVIDPSGRLPEQSRCLADDGARRIVIGATGGADFGHGIEHIRLPSGAEGLSPSDIVTALRRLGLRRLLIEGGGQTVSRFLAARCFHRLHVMVAPMIIGAGPVGLSFGALADLNDAHRPTVITYGMPGGDVLFDCVFDAQE